MSNLDALFISLCRATGRPSWMTLSFEIILRIFLARSAHRFYWSSSNLTHGSESLSSLRCIGLSHLSCHDCGASEPYQKAKVLACKPLQVVRLWHSTEIWYCSIFSGCELYLFALFLSYFALSLVIEVGISHFSTYFWLLWGVFCEIQELNIPEKDVEHLLVSLILDNRVHGHIDQVNQLLELGDRCDCSPFTPLF